MHCDTYQKLRDTLLDAIKALTDIKRWSTKPMLSHERWNNLDELLRKGAVLGLSRKMPARSEGESLQNELLRQ